MRRICTTLIIAIASTTAHAQTKVTKQSVKAPSRYSVYRAAPNGLYPIWENNGYVRGHRRGVIGFTDAQVGVGDIFHIGTQPVALMFRDINVQTKFRLYHDEQFHVAAQVGLHAMLPGSSDAFFSDNFSSRLHNPDDPVFLLPITVAVSWDPLSFLGIHLAATALPLMSPGPLEDSVSFGSFLTVELKAFGNHAVFLHAGEIGMWNHDMVILGASYRFAWEWLEARAGYFYRRSIDGWQGNPLFNVGAMF